MFSVKYNLTKWNKKNKVIDLGELMNYKVRHGVE